MKETSISFYLKCNRIHVFISALYGIGCPRRICFMISSDGKSLLLAPYEKRDFRSHYISPEVYNGKRGFDVHSYKLCHILAGQYHWNLNQSYRVPGWIDKRRQLAVFDLDFAELIDRNTEV